MTKPQRGELRTWLLLILALVPTFGVLSGATWLWRERGHEIAAFEDSMVPSATTYELFLLNAKIRRAEASLRLAALSDATPEQISEAETDRLVALTALTEGRAQLVALLGGLDPNGGEHVSRTEVLDSSLELITTALEAQVAGEPVAPAITTIVALGRETIGGVVLPSTQASNQRAANLYGAVSATIQYLDQFDRDRSQLLDDLLGSEQTDLEAIEQSRALRESLWRDLTGSRTFLSSVSTTDWLGTTPSPAAPYLLDSTEPFAAVLQSIMPSDGPRARTEFFHRVRAIDTALEADVNLAYARVTAENEAHLNRLKHTRSVTAVISSFMAVLGLALAVLTLLEVRRRRRIEAAHATALDKLDEKAHRDPTTGVWNRRWLEAVLPAMIETAPQADETVVLVYLDLDHFKSINDVWGHNAGDAVLNKLTRRLSGFVFSDVSFELSRIGGDEFILFAQTASPSLRWLEGLGEDILRAVGSRMKIDGRIHEITASVGIATSTADSNLDSLLLEADSSLILAKQERGTAVVYDRNTSRTGELVHALPLALAAGEIRAHLQPVVDIHTGEVSHVEALARWHRPGGQQVSPTEFIPLVESYGLAEELTTAMLASVRDILHTGTTPKDVRVWVNVSPRELDVAHFADRFVHMLQDLHISPTRVGIEIIETAAVRDPVRLAVELRRLREVGVKIAIDDFGNGYSPLGYLRDLPVHVVKLDRSLVSNIDTDAPNQHLVGGIVGLADELGMTIVAEGVEREQERQWLLRQGVKLAQGYLFGQPTEPEHVEWAINVDPDKVGSGTRFSPADRQPAQTA